MKNINNYAIVLIYPDGTIDRVMIGKKTSHVAYFKALNEISPRFKKVLTESNILIDEIRGNIRGVPSNLNLYLSELGIVSFLNLRIKEMQRNKLYLNAKPHFLVILPNELTDEQKIVFNELFSESDYSKCYYGKFDGYETHDIEYNDVEDILVSKYHK